jgi:hypothetical protein
VTDEQESDETLVVVADDGGPILMVPCKTRAEATELHEWFGELHGTLSPKPDWIFYTSPLEVVEDPTDRDKMAELFYAAARNEGYAP